MLRLPLLLLAASVTASGQAHSEVVQLAGGGRLIGGVDSTQSRRTLTVELDGGGRVTLNRRDVAGVASESPAESEYRRRAPTAPDTVESQWALAMWCQQRKLRDAYRLHLQRVVELDPTHDEARELLGYQRHGGRWLTREQVMAARGMVRFQGDYRTPQEVVILKQTEQAKKSHADWKDKLRRWRRWLSGSDPKRSTEAAANYAALKDSAAGPALAEQLLEESDPAAKLLLIKTAAQIRHGATVRALTAMSLEDADEEVRFFCLEQLERAGTPGLSEPYVRALRSKSNQTVNRAAAALQELDSTESVAPLVDALITEHRYKVGESSSGGQRFDITAGGGGFRFGSGGAKIIKREIENPSVLSALVTFTGENYGYDQRRWRQWLADREKSAPSDLRRDG